MYITQKGLLAGLGKDFVRELMRATERRSYREGDFVFHEGNHASRFYVLIKGRVKLTIGSGGQVAFTVNHAGEAFGWSSLLGRSSYAGSAQCAEPTKLLRIDRIKFNRILDKDPENGLKLIRHLAEMLGHRLKETYRMMATRERMEMPSSLDTAEAVEEAPPAF